MNHWNGDWLDQSRKEIEVCTDPQRRCYNGVFFKSEMQWTEWATLSSWTTKEESVNSINEWRAFKLSGVKIEYRTFNKLTGETE